MREAVTDRKTAVGKVRPDPSRSIDGLASSIRGNGHDGSVEKCREALDGTNSFGCSEASTTAGQSARFLPVSSTPWQ